MLRSRRARLSCLLLASVFAGALPLAQGMTGQAHAWPFGNSVSELEKKFLEAETLKDKEKSIEIWKDVLSGLEKGQKSANPAISARYARAAVIGDYLSLYAKELDIDHLEKAREFIRSSFSDPAERAWALADMAGRLSVDPSFQSVAALRRLVSGLIDDAGVEAGALADAEKKGRIYYALATVLTRTADDDRPVFGADGLAQAHELVGGIQDAGSRARAMKRLAVAGRNVSGAWPEAYAPIYEALAQDKVSASDLFAVHEKVLASGHFELALASLLVIEKEKERTAYLFPFFEKTFQQGDISRARRIAEKIDNPAKAVDAWSTLAGHYLIQGYATESREAYEKAKSAAALIRKEESREKAYKLIDDRKARDAKKAEKKSDEPGEQDLKRGQNAIKALNDGDIAAAVATARTIENTLHRVRTFRQIAQTQTAKNDKYGILKETGREASAPYRLEGAKKGGDANPSPEAIDAYEKEIGAEMNENPKGLITRQGLESAIGEVLPAEPLIDRLAANGDTIRAMVPLPGAAEVERSYYENNLFSGKFYEVYGNAGFVAQQGTTAPEVVVIESGRIDLPALADILEDRGYGDDLSREGKVYTLRRPVVIGPKATLVITGDDVRELRLSTQSGAFLVNVGRLYMSDSRLIAWNDAKNEPMWARYEEKRNFRPFLTNWSQSEIYMGNSEIVALGYANGKSYGLSLSAGPSAWFKFGNDNQTKRPTGIIVDNSFNNTLYGFYSYEADDAVIGGNEYIDNIVYGVDPHDRSRRLAIGYNTAYGTHKKHGIIISREVNDSIIFGNVTFENKGTGIMLDRDSNGTLVYGNTTFHNAQEGMTLFESDCEIVAANRVFENKGSGFRIRNSYNVGLYHNDIARNGSVGISAYSATLKGDPVHAHRDFDLDPYDELTTVTAVGNTIEANGTGLGIETVSALFLKDNNFIKQSPKILRGSMFKDNPELLFRHDQKKYGVSVNASCPALPEPLYVQGCKFRENGALRGDGMDRLIERIGASACAQSTTDTKKTTAHGGEANDEE